MSSAPTYNNPFSKYNANLMTADEILAYWCSPFFSSQASGVDEKQVFTDAQPIVFEGGRGTGKTMFLRYFSHEVQTHDFKRSAGSHGGMLDHAIKNGGVGIYVRMDGALVRDFTGKGVTEDVWDAVFGHYFDLHVCQKYVELVKSWCSDSAIEDSEVATFVGSLCQQLGDVSETQPTLDHAIALVADRINEVRDFRAAVSFEKVRFKPSKAVAAGDLTFGIPRALSAAISRLQTDFRFIILLDEYENFSRSQQRALNTLLKFPREDVTFRVGMRREGFHTADTISPDEFIKVGRDYTAVVFEDILTRNTEYQTFLQEVARRRLEAAPFFKQKQWCDIRMFLGAKEDIEKEARELRRTARRTRHLEKAVEELGGDEKRVALETLSCPDNPLLELLNAVWLMRGRSIKDTQQGMYDYLAKRKTDLEAKYRRDYVDKYKLSLMFLLASHEKKDKLYYSFNTYCFLSSGIVGNFLELCRRAFQIAAFENREALLEEGLISPKLQNMAAREVGKSELDMIRRIPEYGIKLSHFANSLGNSFRTYHRDPHLRYPETNQLSVDLSTVPSEEDRSAFKAAIRWSVIQTKPRLQGSKPGGGKTEIYTLNRIIAPVFQISYRTRGGKSVAIPGDRLSQFFSSDSVLSNLEERDQEKRKLETRSGFLFPSDEEN